MNFYKLINNLRIINCYILAIKCVRISYNDLILYSNSLHSKKNYKQITMRKFLF